MTKNVVIKPEITRKYREFLYGQRILFFSAPCGFGKTCVAETLLAGKKVLRQEGRTLDVSALPLDGDWEYLLVEDFQQLQEEGEIQALCDLIRRTPEKRFVLGLQWHPEFFLDQEWAQGIFKGFVEKCGK